MAAESGGTEKMQLEPYIHQVGGRSSMLYLNQETICKPLIQKELLFYESLPDSLKPYTPEFRGTVQVLFEEDPNGYLSLSILGNDVQIKEKIVNDENGTTSSKHRIKMKHSGGIEIEFDGSRISTPLFSDADDNYSTICHNPWVLRCHNQQLTKISSNTSGLKVNSVQKFILLENLAAKYKFPNVLDLKMGTRLHGDDASVLKQQNHQAKVESTTSGKLGVRVNGMQVYQSETGCYTCHNKFYGRTLSVEGFKQALYSFFHNGTHIRNDVLSSLIEKLHQLSAVVSKLETFRFFTSSLLILYDGHISGEICNENVNQNHCLNNSNQPKDFSEKVSQCCSFPSKNVSQNVELKMIDFAHSTHKDMQEESNFYSGVDDGYLFGLSNLIAQLKSIHQECGGCEHL